MEIKEIKASELKPKEFISDKVRDIRAKVVGDKAINALSGGVDSSAVTMLGHEALGDRLLTYFIDNGLMREGEPQRIVSIFDNLGVKVELIDAQDKFFAALKGLTDPEQKREAVTQTFYKDVFGGLVRESGAKYLLQGTILTDVDETAAGVKRQHNVFEQIGIDTQKEFGYKILEPLVQLRKDGVRKVAEALGLPKDIYNRMPFPGPALAARVIGEATPERIAIVRKATKIVEEIISGEVFIRGGEMERPFQYLAILHEDRVTGMRDGKRDYGLQIEVRCWESTDARTAKPTRLPYDTLDSIARVITNQVPGVVSVTYNITRKPTSTIEAI